MTKHKKLVNEILLYMHENWADSLRAWEIDTGQAYAVHSVKEALVHVKSVSSLKKDFRLGAHDIFQRSKGCLKRIFYGKKGHPDITGMYKGMWIGIEVKIGTDSQNEDQKNFQRMVNKFGGWYTVISDAFPYRPQVDSFISSMEKKWQSLNSSSST